MRTMIQILCVMIPFPKIRRRVRADLKSFFNVQLKPAKHISVDAKILKKVKKSKYFNSKYYLMKYPDVKNSGLTPLEHYITQGYKLGYNPSAKFDNDFYLFKYPDIKDADMNPLVHYVMYGRREGRHISCSISDFESVYGGGHIAPGTVLLVTHELSLTGAPIALQKMANVLKKNNKKFLILSPLHGDLEKDLKKQNLPYLVDTSLFFRLWRGDKSLQEFISKFETVVLNTIVTLKYAPYMKSAKRKICWVHEGAFGYDNESRIVDVKHAFENVDAVYSVGAYSKCFTNKYIPESKSKTLLYGIDEIKRPRDVAPSKKMRFGIFGVCCERKGQDLFLQAVREMPANMRDQCEFVIVGKRNNGDFDQKLNKLAHGLNIVFTGQLSHDDTVRKMAEMDIIVCPSLDDPMPIVCTEAAVLGIPVICSDQTGTSGFVADGENGFVYKYNRDNLKDILVQAYHMRDKLPEMGRRWHQVYDENFNMDVFERNVFALLNPPKEKCQIFMNTFESKDVPYSDMFGTKFLADVGINTGNILISNYGARQQNYDFVFSNKIDSDINNVTIFAANVLRANTNLNFERWETVLKDPAKHFNLLGLGAQATLEDMNPKVYAKNLPADVVKWVSTLADRCVSIGVRGEFTADVLRHLGIKNVDIIGCPSWFVNGYEQPIITKKEYNELLKPVFHTCWEPYSEYHVGWNRALLDNMLHFEEPRFVIQSEFDFIPYMIANRNPMQAQAYLTPAQIKKAVDTIQRHFGLSRYEVLENDKIRNMFEIFSNLNKWADFVKTRDVSFGFRIHGTIMAIKNGIPGICIVTDSRTYEMCQLFKIPFIRVDQLQSCDLDFRKIYEQADFSEMNNIYLKLLENYKQYLDKNGIKHKL